MFGAQCFAKITLKLSPEKLGTLQSHGPCQIGQQNLFPKITLSSDICKVAVPAIHDAASASGIVQINHVS